MTAAEKEGNDKQSRRLLHGQLSSLQIPALKVALSSEFYAAVLGWDIEHPHPRFVAPGLIGQWVTDRAPARDAGVLPGCTSTTWTPL
jgi:hypothetical protein